MATYPALTRKLSRKWDRHAPGYDRMSEPMEHMLGFAQARARMIALDLSRGMLERAAYRARALPRHVAFLVGDAEELPFADASLDAVVGSGVFCCVPDVARGFRGVRRRSEERRVGEEGR